MSLERLIRLAQKTGDKLIIHDPVNEQDVVLMSVDDYEALLSLKDEQVPQIPSYFSPKRREEEWQNHVIVPDVPLPPPMPRVVDPEEEDISEDYAPGEGVVTDDSNPFPSDAFLEKEGSSSEEEREMIKEDNTTEDKEFEVVPLPHVVLPPAQSSGWHSVGGVARDRFLSGDWMRHDPDDDKKPGKNEVKNEEEDGDDPVFYEEPIG